MKNPRSMGSKIAIPAALISCFVGAMLLAQTAPVKTNTAKSDTAKSNTTNSTAEAGTYRAFLDNYCVTCHSQSTKIPADDPVALDVGFDNLLSHAGTWERVLRKLSVRAMPPPCSRRT